MTPNELDETMRSTDAGRRLAQRRPLADDVFDVVMDMLMNHSLPPGTRLNIESLARTLGVSPTPVREALAGIEAEGLIIKEPQRGYTVAPLIGLDQLHELIELRLLIEPPTAAAAARLATPRQARELRAFARTRGAGGEDPAANRLDMNYDATFHDMVAELGGNALARETLARLRSHLHMYRLYHHAGQAAATKPEHVAVARAIAAGEPDTAHAAMEAHLRTALGRLDAVFAAGRAKAVGVGSGDPGT
ncbi:MAG TPA: GntR family transcriptional regulator [Lapillicoccus sp.]|uniref:GntR family transcriptional regulator n=1 Tax=Lapillicoccus sp. TaxID=1909287 RepID=UPI002F95FDED